MSDTKDFLIEEYKSLTEALRVNEETGEKRLSFFYTITSAILGAVIFFLTTIHPETTVTGDINNIPRNVLSITEGVIIVFLLGLFAVGIIVQRRLQTRNRKTDGYAQDLAMIRDLFKNNPSIGKLPADYSTFKGDNGKPRKRRFTSLSDIATVMNIVILSTAVTLLVFFITYDVTQSFYVGIGVILISVAVCYGRQIGRAVTRQTDEPTHAGGVLYRTTEKGGLEFLLVKSSDNSSWVLPKGHIEKGETTKEAAVREVIEETGLPGTVVKCLGTIRYKFREKNIVSDFFLMKVAQPENREQHWVTAEEAAELLSRETAELLVKAQKELR